MVQNLSVCTSTKNFKAFRITTTRNSTTQNGRIVIKDLENPHTMLVVRKGKDNKVNFDFLAYPGNVKSNEVRKYDFTGKKLELFQFNQNKTSLYKCNHVANPETATSDVWLKSKVHPDGIFWSEDFQGLFCCYAVNDQRQLSDACALMKMINVNYKSFRCYLLIFLLTQRYSHNSIV